MQEMSVWRSNRRKIL